MCVGSVSNTPSLSYSLRSSSGPKSSYTHIRVSEMSTLQRGKRYSHGTSDANNANNKRCTHLYVLNCSLSSEVHEA